MVARPSRKTGWSSTHRIPIGAAELRGYLLHNTLQGVSVPIQEYRVATAASEVAAIPYQDDPITREFGKAARPITTGFVGGEQRVLRMDDHLGEALAASTLGTTGSLEWMRRVISLLEAAVGQLPNQVHPAQGTLREATSLLRQQIDPPAAREVPDGRERLLAWQSRKVRDYIDSHLTGRILVADLCVLVQRSKAHFARSFKRTFAESPHCFVVRRRVELAAQYMLTTDASLSDIALRCGFTDHAHLCKQFRQGIGQTPAAWRRAHRSHQDEHWAPPA
jgi:AraC-like DNA-binding protein